MGVRPAAGNAGHVWAATDTGRLSMDTGAAWVESAPLVSPTFTGGASVASGLTVSSSGITVTGNSTITGTLGGITTLTATTVSATTVSATTLAGALPYSSLTGVPAASTFTGISGYPGATGTGTLVMSTAPTVGGNWVWATGSIHLNTGATFTQDAGLLTASGGISTTTLAASGAVTVGSTLGVTGAITATTIACSGATATFAGGMSGTFVTVTGTLTANALSISTGAASVAGGLTVGGGTGLIVNGNDNTSSNWSITSGNLAGTVRMRTRNDGGRNETIVGWTTTSTERVKRDIQTVDNGLAIVNSLRPTHYERTDVALPHREYGLIAEEVDRVLPQVVGHGEDGSPTGVRYDNLIAPLVAAVQELAARVESMERAA